MSLSKRKWKLQTPASKPTDTVVCDCCKGPSTAARVKLASWDGGWMATTQTTTDFLVDDLGDVDVVTDTKRVAFKRIKKGWICLICQRNPHMTILAPNEGNRLKVPTYEPPESRQPALRKIALKA